MAKRYSGSARGRKGGSRSTGRKVQRRTFASSKQGGRSQQQTVRIVLEHVAQPQSGTFNSDGTMQGIAPAPQKARF